MKPNTPIYSLDEIQKRLREANVDALSLEGNSERDARNLGYSDEDVCDCICSLEEGNFSKTKEYSLGKGKTTRLDVYLITHTKATGETDDLYIKLKYFGWVVVASFHRQR